MLKGAELKMTFIVRNYRENQVGYAWPFGFETASAALSNLFWLLCRVSIRNPSAAQRRLR